MMIADASVRNRRIALMLGVHHSTVDEDVGGNPPHDEKNANENNVGKDAAGGNPPPALSGKQAARINKGWELRGL